MELFYEDSISKVRLGTFGTNRTLADGQIRKELSILGVEIVDKTFSYVDFDLLFEGYLAEVA